MAYEKTHLAIASRISQNWGTDTIIFAENQPEQQPDGATWVRWSVRPADRFSADCTGLMERSIGVIYFQIFTPEMQGTRRAHEVARKIASIFNEARFGTDDGGAVICRRAKGPLYAGKQDGNIQHNVTVQYQEDIAALNAPEPASVTRGKVDWLVLSGLTGAGDTLQNLDMANQPFGFTAVVTTPTDFGIYQYREGAPAAEDISVNGNPNAHWGSLL